MAMVERTKVILLFRFRSFSFLLVSRASPEFFSRKFKICTEYNQMQSTFRGGAGAAPGSGPGGGRRGAGGTGYTAPPGWRCSPSRGARSPHTARWSSRRTRIPQYPVRIKMYYRINLIYTMQIHSIEKTVQQQHEYFILSFYFCMHEIGIKLPKDLFNEQGNCLPFVSY